MEGRGNFFEGRGRIKWLDKNFMLRIFIPLASDRLEVGNRSHQQCS
jgi:hypothetical protein